MRSNAISFSNPFNLLSSQKRYKVEQVEPHSPQEVSLISDNEGESDISHHEKSRRQSMGEVKKIPLNKTPRITAMRK